MLEALLPALIQGGTSLLGGLFNKKKDNRAHNKAVWKSNQAQVNIANRAEVAWNQAVEKKAQGAGDFMMKEAARLGINPITYLQAGGLSHAYSVATVGLSKPAYSFHIRPEEAYQSTGQTTGESLQGALSSFGSALASGIQQTQQNDFQRELVGLQLAAANRVGGGSRGKGFADTLPLMTYSGSRVSRSAGSGSGVLDGHDLAPSVSIPTTFGRLTNPHAMDTKAYDKFLGEDASGVLRVIDQGPGILKQPANRAVIKRGAEAWYKQLDEYTQMAWDTYVRPNLTLTVKTRTPGYLDKRPYINPNQSLRDAMDGGAGWSGP